MPTRRSDTERLWKLVERADPDRGRRRHMQVAPGPATDVHRHEAEGERRLHVVVDAIADVGDLRSSEPGLGHEPLEEATRGLFDAPAGRGAGEVDVLADDVLEALGRVADHAHAQAARAQSRQAGQRVRIEVLNLELGAGPLDAEQLPDLAVVAAARDQPAECSHQGEARDAGDVGGALPEARLVDERLPGVEHDRLYSQEDTSSRSEASVTLSSFGSPSTVRTRPPAASTSEAQSVTPATSPPIAFLSTSATNAWGVCAATRSSRAKVSTTSSPRTRLIVSFTGRAGTTPSQPSERGASTRAITSSLTSGLAASWTRTTAASRGTSASAARTESARVSPPVTDVDAFSHVSSSARRIEGSSQSGGAAVTIPSIHSESFSLCSGTPSRTPSPSGAKAFGRSRPSLSPRPAATRTAQTLIVRR